MIKTYLRVLSPALWKFQPQVLIARRCQWNIAAEISDSVPDAYRSPFSLVENDLRNIPVAIGEELSIGDKKLLFASRYHFDQLGKLFRPTLVLLMGRLINAQLKVTNRSMRDQFLNRQFRVAMIAEMIHTASLIHDDILDASPVRRNEPTVHVSFGMKTAVLTGDFILSRASRLIARLNNCVATEILALILEDLVVGEMMQAAGAAQTEPDTSSVLASTSSFDWSCIRPACQNFFVHYLERIYYKTASLMANTCKAAGVVSDCGPDIVKTTFDIGRQIGMAFQIMDDLLDITSQLQPGVLGKPTGADLKLGLATAPVLFASTEHPELIELIGRRFSHDGDIQNALSLIHKSDALEQTRRLARHHATEAIHLLNTSFIDSPYRTALSTLAMYVIQRNK